MAIIALAGRRKTGKSLAADLVVEVGASMSISIRRVSFSTALKEMYAKEAGVAMRLLIDPETKEEFRESLIDFADTKRREDPMLLIHALFSDISLDEHIVIDDLRTIEELAAVLRVGGKPYKIIACAQCRESRGYKYNSHIDNGLLETEMDLSGDTFRVLGGGQIFNTGSQNYLKKQIFEIVREEYCKLALAM